MMLFFVVRDKRCFRAILQMDFSKEFTIHKSSGTEINAKVPKSAMVTVRLREVFDVSNIHPEDQANGLQQKQQMNSTLLKLTHEETYQIAQPAKSGNLVKLIKQNP